MKRVDLGVSRGPSEEERSVIKKGYEKARAAKNLSRKLPVQLDIAIEEKETHEKTGREFYEGELEQEKRRKTAREALESQELSKEENSALRSGTRPIPGAQLNSESPQGKMAEHSAAFLAAAVKKDRPKMEAARTAFHAVRAETGRGGIPWKHGVETPCSTSGCVRTEHRGPHSNEISVSRVRANPAGES